VNGWSRDRPGPKTRRTPELDHGSSYEVVEDDKVGSNWVQDAKTGLLLPDGARKTKHPPGFGSDWE
jgi:hypothetical protein